MVELKQNASVNAQRYFAVSTDQHEGYDGVLMPDNDIVPLDSLTNAVQVYPSSAGVVEGYEDMKLILAIIQPRQQRDLAEIAEQEDWATLEAVVALDIVGSYAGEELTDHPRAGVFARYPELAGTKQIGTDEQGEPILVDIVSRTRWP